VTVVTLWRPAQPEQPASGRFDEAAVADGGKGNVKRRIATMTHLVRPIAATTLLAASALLAGPIGAEQCFLSEQSLNVDAQNIRQKALAMGWGVGKTASFTAAGLVSGKATLYPKDPVEICLEEKEGKLRARVQSKSPDAGQADWHDLYAEKQP